VVEGGGLFIDKAIYQIELYQHNKSNENLQFENWGQEYIIAKMKTKANRIQRILKRKLPHVVRCRYTQVYNGRRR
jgi:hypothetical protein